MVVHMEALTKYWVGKKVAWVFHKTAWKNPNKLFGQPNTYILGSGFLIKRLAT